MKNITLYLLLSLIPLSGVSLNDTPKDSLIIKRRHGHDKRYYKACKGKDIIMIYSEDWSPKTIYLDGKINGQGIVPGLLDKVCPPEKSLLRLISNDSLKETINKTSAY